MFDEEIKVNPRGIKYQIIQDDFAFSPRDEQENLGTMICFHARHTLGDRNNYGYKSIDYSSWEEMQEDMEKRFEVVIPIFAYDHSGIALQCTPFSCRWDSGQVGFIVVERDKLLKWFNRKRMSKKLKALVTDCLIREVKDYSAYVSGDTYAVKIYSEDEEYISTFYSEQDAEDFMNTY